MNKMSPKQITQTVMILFACVVCLTLLLAHILSDRDTFIVFLSIIGGTHLSLLMTQGN